MCLQAHNLKAAGSNPAPATKANKETPFKSTVLYHRRKNPGILVCCSRQKRDNRRLKSPREWSRKMLRKRSEAAPAKTGRIWSPIKGLTLTERGPLQVQARVRRTGRPSQTKTFETVD